MLQSLLVALLGFVNLATFPAESGRHFKAGRTVTGCTVIDGDTIRCGSERIRLIGIDAPELAGHCRRGRTCVPGDGQSSKRSLVSMMGDPVTVTRYGRDRYGRTLAIVHAGGVNLSCRQIQRRQAVYKPRWDNGGRVAAACPRIAR